MDRAWLSLWGTSFAFLGPLANLRKGSNLATVLGRVSLWAGLASPGPLFHDLVELSDLHVCALPKPGWGKPANALQ